MSERVPIEFSWYGPRMPAGSSLSLEGRVVGQLTKEAVGTGEVAHAEIDVDIVDKIRGHRASLLIREP